MSVRAICFAAAIALGGALGAAPSVAAEPPPLPELRFVEVPATARDAFAGDRFSYMEAGPKDAPVVMLLHGIGANSFYWRYQYAALSDRFRLIAWNAPGYILTDPLRKERPDCNDFADAFAAFADAMNLKTFAMIGNSFGSAVAQCFAARYPERVTRVALSGTSIGAAATPPEVREQTFQRRQKQFERAGGMTYAKEIYALVASPKTPPEAKPLIMEVLAATNGRGYLQASFVPFTLDTLAFAPKIKVPVLLYHGTEDKIAPIEKSSVLLGKALPNARLVRFEGYGHLPDVELPDQVNALLRDFLSAK